ncbi:phage portal protein [Clostridium sp. JN-1]|uniref:phage portal protein n=1 Tax=Clostridium sp. JN-1 TaxID=2483110 RepID=UPI000F0B2897|nr:phage portal protein [Clostridium sp. JN-1]
MDTRQQLLGLTNAQLKERKQSKNDYFYYKGKCQDESLAISDSETIGQSWTVSDDLDYVPAQDIRNKVGPLLRKQARFMFSIPPDILFKPYDIKDKYKCEELRQFIDKILTDNSFWSDTLKAFLDCTVRRRVLLRIEANPEQPINIFYNPIDDFTYKTTSSNYKRLQQIILVVQEPDTADLEQDKQIWYRHTYSLENNTCMHQLETFTNGNFDKPVSIEIVDTKLDRLPAWVILNDAMLGDIHGKSDVTDLRDAQNSYNRKVSDYADALRFNMFGERVIIDADENSVNSCKVAPGAIIPLKSVDEDHKADAKRLESSFTSADPAEKFLDRAEKDMYETLDMPRQEELKNVPSAKALKYLYNDLIARCNEKWNTWEPVIKDLIKLIIECCSKFNCYKNWNHEWDDLEFNIVFNHNFPIPEDMDDKKMLAMNEVQANVRSHKSYIKDFSNTEDADGEMDEIIKDISDITAAENDEMQSTQDGNLDE